MKNLTLIISLLLLTLLVVKNSVAQDVSEKNKIIFVFNSKEDFTNKFENKTDKKIFNFIIDGINSPEQKQELINKIKAYRGVEDFVINKKIDNGKYEAVITLYEYADHWMYYKFLFIKNGIDEIIIADELIKSEKLSEL